MLFKQKVQVNYESLHVLVVVQNLSQEVVLELAEERQRVLSNNDLLSPLEELNCSDINLLKVYLTSTEDLSADEVRVLVHPADFNQFVGREEGQNGGRYPDSEVFEKTLFLV